MAGDWLKIEVALPEKPEVWQIAGLTGLDPDLIVGKLFKVWRWFDAHTETGNARSVTYALVDSITGVTGFAEAMVFAGWLEQHGTDLSLPNFDRHNGKTAKNRALTAKRVGKIRNAGSVTSSVTSALPREEKRREENKEQKQEPVRSPSGSRLSADWSLPDDWRSWAERERPDVDVLRESRVFADYWAGQAGAKGRKADWQATWRNWIRRADARPRGSPDAPSKSLSAIQRLQSMKIPENGNDPELASERDFGWPQQARLPPAR